ncbi:MAG: TerB family tellurite resistance protein [Polyangiaceae bacterium]|nr:TerB family tellurite resistance protein [Polyangiaceae bacterium]MCW5792671.1 TerB family tellurite resistance protein [Polyangiaceae bacterium]
MLDTLKRDERLLLLKFVCAFAWADLEVDRKERRFVLRLVRQLKLTPDEREQVEGWLENPPTPEEVDPATVPHRHRQLFLDTAKRVIEADGNIDPNEAEVFELLEQLLLP